MDDWVGGDEDEVSFICIDCQPGPESLLLSKFNTIILILHIYDKINV